MLTFMSFDVPTSCCAMPAGSLLKYYTSERDVGRRYRGLLSLEVRAYGAFVCRSTTLLQQAAGHEA
jgi:hypothetical protein